jgi:Flp pilus assembly protein TadB
MVVDSDRAAVMGQMVDAVSYMAMSMRLVPSLHKAILFAARNVGEPLASHLRQVVLDVELRRFETLEEAFLDLARSYDPGNEEFQQALRSLRTAELQVTPDGVERSLDRATSTVFEGTRRRVREFADGLQRPVFVLFSLGVVLPLMVGSMLPLMSAGGLGGSIWVAIALMDILFPLLFILAARRILDRRPLVRSPPRCEAGLDMDPTKIVLALAVGAALVGLGILSGHLANDVALAEAQLDAALADGSIVDMGVAQRTLLEDRANAAGDDPLVGLAVMLGPLPILWGVAAAVAILYVPTLREPRRRRKEVEAVEEALPDALFQIGSRVADGMPLEPAIRRTASNLGDEPLAHLLRRVLAHMTLKRTSATEALFGREGALTGFPSENVSASLKTIVSMVRKDVSGAGRTIVAVSDHLRDLRKVDREVASRLRPVTDMMRSTAVLFAPVILGITSALYLVVARLAPSLPFSSGATAPIPAGTFALVLGIFVMAMVTATMLFTSRLSHGEDPVEGRYQAARALPVAIGVFSIASMVGQVVIV